MKFPFNYSMLCPIITAWILVFTVGCKVPGGGKRGRDSLSVVPGQTSSNEAAGDSEENLEEKGNGVSGDSFVLEGGKVQLRGAIEHGLKQNLDVLIAEAEEAVARESLVIAGAEFTPEIQASVSGNRLAEGGNDSSSVHLELSKKVTTGGEISLVGTSSSSPYGQFAFPINDGQDNLTTAFLSGGDGDELSTASEGTSEVYVQLRQPLLRGAGLSYSRSSKELARLLVSGADIAKRAQVFQFVIGAEAAYWSASVAKAQSILEERSLTRAREVLSRIKALKEANSLIASDVLEAEATVAEREAVFQEAAKRFEDAQDDLWLLVGAPVDARPEGLRFAGIEKYLAMPEEQVDVEKIYALAMNSYPEVLLVINTVERRRIEVQRAKNEARPQLDLVANGGFTGSGDSFGGSFGDDAFYGGAIEFSMPWNLGAERARLRQAQAELSGSEFRRQQAEQELQRDIRQRCRDVLLRQKQLTAMVRGSDATEEKWRQMSARFEQGLVTVRDLLEAEEEAREAKRRENATRLNLAVSEIRLAQYDGTLLTRHQLKL